MKSYPASRHSRRVLSHKGKPASYLPGRFLWYCVLQLHATDTVWFQQVGIHVEHCYSELLACLYLQICAYTSGKAVAQLALRVH